MLSIHKTLLLHWIKKKKRVSKLIDTEDVLMDARWEAGWEDG